MLHQDYKAECIMLKCGREPSFEEPFTLYIYIVMREKFRKDIFDQL